MRVREVSQRCHRGCIQKKMYTIDALGEILGRLPVLILGISQNISKIFQKYFKISQKHLKIFLILLKLLTMMTQLTILPMLTMFALLTLLTLLT